MSEIAEVIDAKTGELVEIGDTAASTLFGTTNPDAVIEKARGHAVALKKVIDDRGLSKRIRNRDHVLIEGWTLLGSMVGVFPVEDVPAEPVELNGVFGFKATVKAVTRSGEVVGRATAFCMKDEPNWTERETYALASMAQTRAASKALRLPLGFIVQLAGYAATPAEEMPDEESNPVAASEKADKNKVTQLAILRQQSIEAGEYKDEDEFRAKLHKAYGVYSLKDLSKDDARTLAIFLQGKLNDKSGTPV